MQPVVLLIDLFLYALLLSVLGYGVYVVKTPPLKASWGNALKRPVSVASAMVLSFFIVVAILDSIHFRLPLSHPQDQQAAPRSALGWLASAR